MRAGIYAAGLWAEGRRKQRLKYRQISRGLARQMGAVDATLAQAVHSTQLRANIAAAAALQPALLSGVPPPLPGPASATATTSALRPPADGTAAGTAVTLGKARQQSAEDLNGAAHPSASAIGVPFGLELSTDQLMELGDRRGALTSRGRLEKRLSAERERCSQPRRRAASAEGRVQGTAAQQEADAADRALPEAPVQADSAGAGLTTSSRSGRSAAEQEEDAGGATNAAKILASLGGPLWGATEVWMHSCSLRQIALCNNIHWLHSSMP